MICLAVNERVSFFSTVFLGSVCLCGNQSLSHRESGDDDGGGGVGGDKPMLLKALFGPQLSRSSLQNK